MIEQQGMGSEQVWPPALSLQTTLDDMSGRKRTIWIGRSSLLCSVLSVLSVVAVVALGFITSRANEEISYMDWPVRISFVAQVALQVIAVVQGVRARSVRIGKVGVVVGIIGLCAIVGWALFFHMQDSDEQWPWNYAASNDECRCS